MNAPLKKTGKNKAGLIENISEKLRLIPSLKQDPEIPKTLETPKGDLNNYPAPDQWDDWVEYEAKGWGRKSKKHYSIIPTICFNCEAGCGLLGYIDKETGKVRKFEGNPHHPGSRGRNCAKGPATINQIDDVDRILYPMKRTGKRGEGKWERVSWEEALKDIAGKIREALVAEKRDEVVYHVGRPGHEGYVERVLQSWGVDGYNSHTNICSSGARTGYATWHGHDRPSPDYANAQTILLISSHLEAGHYFNPHAQRIIEAKNQGAKLIVMDTRLSNSASRADHWLAVYPGSEAAMLLAVAKIIIDEGWYNEEFLRDWVNWEDYLKHLNPNAEARFEDFIGQMSKDYEEYTPEFAEQETGVPKERIVECARLIGQAGTRFAAHNWRSAGSGNLGGWQVARTLHFLSVLTGSVGTVGGTSPNDWNKFHPDVPNKPPAQKFWNELHFPDEYPLTHFELSMLLPHFLKEGRGKLSVYFTRVFNPVWTYPDGFTWMEALSDESKVGLHVALTPTWNETAYYADYVLPMGHASERHDIVSYETHSGMWIGFRQPILREYAKKEGKPFTFTYEVNPGEVWEEDEFWIELSWKIDPDGSLGIRKHFLSPYREGEKINIDEYYQYVFERVKGLPEAAEKEGLTPLDYMRKYGAFEVSPNLYELHKQAPAESVLKDSETLPNGVIVKDGQSVGVRINGQPCRGFNSPSKKQEYYSATMEEWNWPEYKIPTYIHSHIHWENIDYQKGEFPLIPTFRLPTLIHSRSGNAKWLMEISNKNPMWIHPGDMERLSLKDDDMIRVYTEIGFFVIRLWSTEGIRPGVLACSHHLGRWRRENDPINNRWAMNQVRIESPEEGVWRMRKTKGIEASSSEDADTERIFWQDGGVHQNIAFPVHPDPVSGMHCWHQKVRIEKAREDDQYGDVEVDTRKSMEVYRKWLAMTRKPEREDGLRRPLWLKRPLKPAKEMFYKK